MVFERLRRGVRKIREIFAPKTRIRREEVEQHLLGAIERRIRGRTTPEEANKILDTIQGSEGFQEEVRKMMEFIGTHKTNRNISATISVALFGAAAALGGPLGIILAAAGGVPMAGISALFHKQGRELESKGSYYWREIERRANRILKWYEHMVGGGEAALTSEDLRTAGRIAKLLKTAGEPVISAEEEASKIDTELGFFMRNIDKYDEFERKRAERKIRKALLASTDYATQMGKFLDMVENREALEKFVKDQVSRRGYKRTAQLLADVLLEKAKGLPLVPIGGKVVPAKREDIAKVLEELLRKDRIAAVDAYLEAAEKANAAWREYEQHKARIKSAKTMEDIHRALKELAKKYNITKIPVEGKQIPVENLEKLEGELKLKAARALLLMAAVHAQARKG